MSSNNSHSNSALLEEINDRLKKVQESLYDLKDIRKDTKRIKKDITGLKDWSDIARLVIKDQSKTLNNHETRLTSLEAL